MSSGKWRTGFHDMPRVVSESFLTTEIELQLLWFVN